MTPAARLSAAIEVLDRVVSGTPAEKALTNWARGNRYAGSGDRLAVRDTVFDALRCKRSFAHLGGAMTGRGLVLGGLRAAGVDPEALFSGEGHAPACLTVADAAPPVAPEALAALDCPDWLAPALQASLGDGFAPVMQLLRQRAPVFLRANLVRGTRDQAQAALRAEGIDCRPHALSSTALEVMTNPRKIQTSQAFLTGKVELQDAASQAVADYLPLLSGQRVLDYCAGGGGKSLALAARMPVRIFAHDVDPARMRDLPVRAKRAGVRIEILTGSVVDQSAPFGGVVLDVPCSGSGSWRRAPEAKWAFSAARLDHLRQLQSEILDRAQALVAPDGWLAYVTCSLLAEENDEQVLAFLERHPNWGCERSRALTPLEGGDGFFVAVLRRLDSGRPQL